MTRDQATHIVNAALDLLIQNDLDLLEVRISERAIQFRLAHYIARSEEINPPLTVDCEYNRRKADIKKLTLDNLIKPAKVFPYIIVHERNKDSNYMIAIEIKNLI